MTRRADFSVNLLGRTPSLECIAAAAMNHYLMVFRMYLFFHNYSSPATLKPCILTELMSISREIFRNFSLGCPNGASAVCRWNPPEGINPRISALVRKVWREWQGRKKRFFTIKNKEHQNLPANYESCGKTSWQTGNKPYNI
jgi:hypothetical protein